MEGLRNKEEIVKGLDFCASATVPDDCECCPYQCGDAMSAEDRHGMPDELIDDVLDLLKEKEQSMSEETKYRSFPQKTIKLKEALMLFRSSCESNYDDAGTAVIICPECEEWTHVKFNLNSCLLDLLGELEIESIDAENGDIVLWIKTDEFNWFDLSKFK